MAEIAETAIPRRCRIDRQMILAVAMAAAVVLVRGALIIRAQSPCIDDNYHLYRGMLFLNGDFATLRNTRLNDPPLGEALSALPAWWHRLHVPDPALAASSIAPPKQYCFQLPESIRLETALWKGLLFLPMVAVVFAWVGGLYGKSAAWLATILLLADPTIAAHLPLPTVDVLGMEGIVIGAWAAWRFVQRPTVLRGAAAALAIAVALLLKHTAVLLPAVLLLYAAVHWLGKHGPPGSRLRRLGALAAVLALVPLLMWALMRFQTSRLGDLPPGRLVPAAAFLSSNTLPMGTYLASLAEASAHASWGHKAYLSGQSRIAGWWYYFFVVALFKVPLGIALVFLVALASLIWRRPRHDEIPLLIAAAVWTISLSLQHIDIGFRHFLPPYAFLLMLSCRCVGGGVGAAAVAAWAGAALAALHSTLWIPDQLSYINFPRSTPAYLSISDSNIDWGQSLKQVRRWIDRQADDGRPIYVGYFGPFTVNLYDQLGPRLTGYSNRFCWLPSPGGQVVTGPMPHNGLLLLSPVLLTGQYDQSDRFAPLRQRPPRQVIGHCILVYDLDSGGAAAP